jgi:two-component system sensor histidine kinase RpfC
MIEFIKQRLRYRGDSEHEQAAIRAFMVGITAFYLACTVNIHDPVSLWVERIVIIYFFVPLLTLACIVAFPGVSPWRRYFSMVMDNTFLSIVMVLEGSHAAPLYPLYLWTSLGNGFRFGVRALRWAALVSTLEFSAMVAVTGFWKEILPLSIGLALTLIAIPAYAATLIKQLMEAKATAEQASQTKSRFLATASHELRTPLHAVIGLSDLLQHTKLTAEQAEMVEVVRMSGRTLLTLVEDVLDLTSIQAGKLASHNIEFDLHKNLAEIAAIMRPQVARKGLTLTVSVSPDTPYQLQGDWPHVRQILINLITNAIKFTECGGIHVGVTSADNSPYCLIFNIVDTGRGIAAVDQERIFDAFTQTNTDLPAAGGGVGLGLAIVRQLADLLHGKVSVKSEAGVGSTFTVEIPFIASKSNFYRAESGKVIVLSDHSDIITALTATPFHVSATPFSADISDSVSLQASSDENGPVVVLLDARGRNVGEATERAQILSESCKTIATSFILIGLPGIATDDPRIRPFASTVKDAASSQLLSTAIHTGFALAHRRDVVDALATGAITGLPVASLNNSWSGPIVENGRRILVVEDSPVNRMVTSKILRSAGYGVVLAEKADDALEIMGEQEFDVILMDLNLPGMSGLEIIKLYRVMRMGLSMPPIGIFSADVTEAAQVQCRDLGIDLFLPKPIEPDVLIAKMRELMPDEAYERQAEPVEASVTSIADHPRYKAAPEMNVIDRQTLQSLANLDSDPAFIAELMETFEKDAAGIMIEIDAAVRNNDMRVFWDLIHAMRSSAANVGAKQIYATCLDIGAQGKMSFQQRGPEYAARLRHNYVKFSRLVHRVFPGAGTEAKSIR